MRGPVVLLREGPVKFHVFREAPPRWAGLTDLWNRNSSLRGRTNG